jgi:tetratricopeptide repeat protein
MSESLDFVFERANSALITQDFEYAERLLTNVLKKHPDILPSDREKIENLLARIYGDEGDLERSLEAYLRLYEREPDNIELMLHLGRIYRHLERYDDALKILEKAKDIGGDTDEVLYSFAKTYKRMHNYDKAVDYFSRAIEIKPDHAHAYDRLGNLYVLIGETDKAIEVYKKGLQVDSNHPYLNFHLAGLLRQQKRYEEAIVYYNSALRINPAWDEVLAGIAAAYLQLDKLDDALNTYRSLLRVTGENAPLYTQLGFLFEKKQLQQEAEQYYYDALAIDSGYAPAAFALTRLLEKKQRYNEALPVLLAAEIAPVNAENHALRLKAIQMCMYAKDYAKAHELFGRLDAEHSNSLDALKLRGQLYALTGEVEQAEATFKQILKTAPAAIEFRQELAEQYLLAHKYEEAKEQLKLFLRQRPDDIYALMALGKAEELLNNPQAAYQEYQKVLELKPEAIEARSALSRLFQKWGNTLEALKTANEILNLQSGSETDEHEQDMAASLDLYEQAAENYIADPLLTKNLEQLKPDDSPLYISPAELNPEAQQKIPSLQDMVMPERELPFEMLIEGTEEVQELPPEKDESAIGTMQLNESQQIGVSDQPAFSTYSNAAPMSYGSHVGSSGDIVSDASPENIAVSQIGNDAPIDQVHTADSSVFTDPVNELYLNPENVETNAAPGMDGEAQKNAQALHKRQNLLRDDAMQERLKGLDTYGTSIGFLQDVISDIDKQLDENRYAQAVEVLAEKIAENLSRKIPMQREILQEEHTQQEPDTALLPEQSDEAVDTSNEEHVPINDTAPVHENVRVDDDNIQVIETQEEAVLGNEKNKISESEIDNNPVEEIVDKALDGAATEEINKDESLNGQSPAAQENDSEIIVDSDEDLFPEDIANDDVIESESSENQTPFILDQEQQNLLWCHAKHQVKGSPSFEQYLNTTDPEQLAQLFLYLRDLFAYLPQGELEIFLNSSERIQIYYIIARLSGELGLKERANLIQQACTVVNAQSPYNDMAVFKLLSYLRDLSIALPDQELGTRVRQELEQLMANMSSVLPDL